MALTLNETPQWRMSADELAQWRSVPAAIVGDELDRTQCMAAAIKPLSIGMGFAGQALTVQSMVGDNLALHHAVALAWADSVLVVDARGHEDTAVWGGILTEAALAKGVAALVLDGSVRDAAELRESGMAVFARGVVPNGPHKGFGGTVNGQIHCAGVTVNPGDLVVGDDDGVVVVRRDQLDGLLDRCRARMAKEDGMVKRIREGASTVDLLGLPGPGDIG